MAIIRVKGILTEDGNIQVELPENWQPGEIEVLLTAESDKEWTDEELEALLKFDPRPAAEIETGGWEDIGIEDSAEWVEEQRRKRKEESLKRWME